MKKIALALAVAVGVMMVAAIPALAGKPAPALSPGGTTTQSCPAGQKVESGKAVYSFKGKNKVTVTSYVAGGFNAFNEPTTATFTTPIEPRFDTVNITLVCSAETVAPPDADNDGVPDASDNCPTVFNTAQGDVDGDGIGNVCDPVDGRDTDFDGVIGSDDWCPNEAGSMFNHGCPDVDTDGDGILDNSDNCWDVFGPAWNRGCPPPAVIHYAFDGTVGEGETSTWHIFCPTVDYVADVSSAVWTSNEQEQIVVSNDVMDGYTTLRVLNVYDPLTEPLYSEFADVHIEFDCVLSP